MSYNVPACRRQAEFEVKKSRFIAWAGPIASRDDALALVSEARQQYPDARHHCWAYLLGNPQAASNAAANDDGEPSGTAGKPILNVIQHKGIGNLAVVVIRYFGGIKLGAGGLVRAYSAATEQVLADLPLQQLQSFVTCTVVCDFAHEQLVRHFCQQHQSHVESVEYRDQVHLHLAVAESAMTLFHELLAPLAVSIAEQGAITKC